MAFFRHRGPTGDVREDLRAGIVASTVANVMRPKGRKALKPEEFMPKFGQRQPTEREQQSWAANVTAALGGEVADDKLWIPETRD